MPNVNLPKYRDLAKGFRHGNKTNKRVMVNRVDKALEHAYVSRKLKKRGTCPAAAGAGAGWLCSRCSAYVRPQLTYLAAAACSLAPAAAGAGAQTPACCG
jgi:hypothetical protein